MENLDYFVNVFRRELGKCVFFFLEGGFLANFCHILAKYKLWGKI
jgi:hypothetical protein